MSNDVGGQRSSHFESAQEANDIYNLYGRDSWASDFGAGFGTSRNYTPRPLSREMHDKGEEDMEELEGSRYSDDEEDEVYATPRPFFNNASDYVSIPPAHMRSSPGVNGHEIGDHGDWNPEEYARLSTGMDFTRQDDEWSVGGHSEAAHPHSPASGIGQALTHDYAHPAEPYPAPHHPHQLAQAWLPAAVPEPVVSPPPEDGVGASSHTTSSRTPSRTPELVVHQSPDAPGEDRSRRASSSAIPSRLLSEQPPQTPPQSLSPTESNTNSPVHPSIARIANSPRNGLSGSAGSSVAGMSNASLVSSQYPGEESDAYHVRSTCECSGVARLGLLTCRCTPGYRGGIRRRVGRGY